MSAEDDTAPEPPEMVPVTLHVPAQILSAINEDVADGIYADTEEGLRHSLVESWRHHRGRYSTLRIDLLRPEDNRPDTDPPDVDDALAFGDALRGELDERGSSDPDAPPPPGSEAPPSKPD